MIEIIRRIIATKWTEAQKIIAIHLVSNSKKQAGLSYRIHDPGTASVIATATGLSDRTVRDVLDTLAGAKLIEKYTTHSKVNRHGQPVAPIRHRRPRWGDRWKVETVVALNPKKWPKILPHISKGKNAEKRRLSGAKTRKQLPLNIPSEGMRVASRSRNLVIELPVDLTPESVYEDNS